MILSRINFVRLFSTANKRGTTFNNQKAKVTKNAFDAFNNDMSQNKDVFNEYRKQVEKDSILKKFRRDIFKKQQISQQAKAYEEDLQKQGTMLQDLLNKGSKQDVIKYSKKIMQKMLNNKKIFKERTLNPVFSDYGDYSSYRSNFAKVEDRNLGDMQRLDRDNTQQNLYEFLDSLPDQYQQKDMIREQIKNDYQHSNENMTISDYGKIIQERLNRQKHYTDGKIQYYNLYKQGKERQQKSIRKYWEERQNSEGHLVDSQNKRNYKVARLSPQAMDTIYECYLQGWTVRDISKRFGILPKRTKFCIWARAQLYDQFLPKYGWKFYYDGLQQELELGQQDGYQDYGLDLDIIKSQRLPDVIVEWNPNRVDSQRKPEEYIQALQKLEKLKKFDRHQKVEIGTHGKENKMYLLKEWNIFRGKGSNAHHLRFKTFRGLSKAKNKMVKQYY